MIKIIDLINLGFISPRWRMPVYAAAGAFCGVALLLTRISAVFSYMSDDPKACINCHVMTSQYAAWERSSHKTVATCNACHLPHGNIFSKLLFKAKDGAWHGFIFTFNLQPQTIRASKAAVSVVHENCERCHQPIFRDVLHKKNMKRLCWDCHQQVPHGDVRSLSSSPDVRRPALKPVIE